MPSDVPSRACSAGRKAKRPFRLIARVVERTLDRRAPRLLVPDIELEGWWTTLNREATEVIELYKHHGMHEQP